MNISAKPFGTTKHGVATTRYTLDNGQGVQALITNYGGTITHLYAPDRNGQITDIVLGFDNVADYESKSQFFGCLVGRYANRIADGRFELEGKTYTLEQNNGSNHLHGGTSGYDKVVWQAQTETAADQVTLILSHESPDGDAGYPGNLQLEVRYVLTLDNQLIIDYTATTDQKTVINLTNHSYFNLAGGGPIIDHLAMINADTMTPVDERQIPTGELASVANTPFDFRKARRIGDHIDDEDTQLARGGGYDHNYVLNTSGDLSQTAARVVDPHSGRVLEMFTTEPGVQFYTGNGLRDQVSKGGVICHPRTGFCLEAQKFPDTPNQPTFPNAILSPGEPYRQTTIYRLTTQ